MRFATECCGYRRTTTTVRVADGDPGVECQIDFGYLGMLDDAATGKRRKVFALVFTAVYSRHTFVWLSHTQTLSTILEGCSAAWEFFGGVFAVIIPDNMKPVVTQADTLNPRLSRGWLGVSDGLCKSKCSSVRGRSMSMALDDKRHDNGDRQLPELAEPRSTAEVAEALQASGMVDELLAQIDTGQVQITGDGGLIPGSDQTRPRTRSQGRTDRSPRL